MKVLGFDGLKTLSDNLKQTMKTADGLSSAVSGLGGDIQGLTGQLAGALQEVENCLNELDAVKANTAVRREFILFPASWSEEMEMETPIAKYPHRYVLEVAGVTPNSRIDAVLDASSIDVAAACGLCPTTETADGIVIFRSRSAPTANLSGQLYITQGAGDAGASDAQTTEQKEE